MRSLPSPQMFPDRVDELAHRIDLLDLGEAELKIELVLDAAHQPYMGKAVPPPEIGLTGVDADHEVIIIELSAENILQPGQDRDRRSCGFGQAIRHGVCLASDINSSWRGTGSMYIVIPLRPRATACSTKGLASAAS